MSNNLAAYFASSNDNNSNNNTSNPATNDNIYYDDDMGPSVSMAIEAENDEDFHNLTFKLKRTQSMGLLDPTNPITKNNNRYTTTTSNNNNKQQLPTPNVIDYDAYSDDYNYDYDYDTNRSDISSNSSDSSSSNISDDLVTDNGKTTGTNNQENLNVNNYTQSSSVSPPAPDDDKLLPQDDNDVVREPQRHVDYLSHHWKESDISNSWKYIIAKKKKRDIDVVNTARLENASWRTWAKARNNLKTVSPEILNWSKDSDVTWLYGPIVRSDNFDNINDSSNSNPHRKKKKLHSKDDYTYDDNDDDDDYDDDYERGYGSDGDETSIRLPSTSSSMVNQSDTTDKHPHTSRQQITPKPILKRRTVTEIIEENAQWRLNEARKHFNEVRRVQSIKDQDNQTSVHDDYDLLAAKVNAQYFNYPSSSSSSNVVSNQQQQQIYLSNSNHYSNNASQMSKDSQVNSSNNKNDIPSYETNESGNSNISNEKDKKTNNSSTTDPISFATSNVTVLNSNHRNIYTISQNNSSPNMKNGTLSSILTTSSDSRPKNNNNNDKTETSTNNNIKKPNKDRHIHFNDRVEQCMVVKYPSSSSDEDMDSGFYSSDDDYNQEFSDYSDSESNSDSSDGENGDEHGLFISARFSRRSDSLAHSPITDNSSIGSNCTSGRHNLHIRPIIKMLPATTLNYGSDDESDNSDFNGGYGNAVSHNVNTQRGYDYIYDYNSVYTGDTSSFLPVDTCDIIDVPEGINLQTAIADDNQQTYKLLSSPDTTPNQSMVPLPPTTSNDQYYNSDDDQYSISSNTDDDQFIENSQYHSSNSGSDSNSSDNEDYLQMGSKYMNGDLGLKRTVSIGRSNNSLVGLTVDSTSNKSLKSALSQTFLNGNPSVGPVKNNANAPVESFQNQNEIPLNRNASKGFIFNSDSEEESDEAPCITDVKENINNPTHEGDLNLNSLKIKPSPRRKLGPPQRSSSNILLNNISQASKCNIGESIKIPGNTVSSANILPSDVAIEGSFSPRNESLKSVISKEKLTNYNNS